jgi:hypothetical protein
MFHVGWHFVEYWVENQGRGASLRMGEIEVRESCMVWFAGIGSSTLLSAGADSAPYSGLGGGAPLWCEHS